METFSNWWTSQTYHITKENIVLKIGDKVAYRSKSRNTIFNDGEIIACSKYGVIVKYALDESFGLWSVGTTKFIQSEKIIKLIQKRDKKVKFLTPNESDMKNISDSK